MIFDNVEFGKTRQGLFVPKNLVRGSNKRTFREDHPKLSRARDIIEDVGVVAGVIAVALGSTEVNADESTNVYLGTIPTVTIGENQKVVDVDNCLTITGNKGNKVSLNLKGDNQGSRLSDVFYESPKFGPNGLFRVSAVADATNDFRNLGFAPMLEVFPYFQSDSGNVIGARTGPLFELVNRGDLDSHGEGFLIGGFGRSDLITGELDMSVIASRWNGSRCIEGDSSCSLVKEDSSWNRVNVNGFVSASFSDVYLSAGANVNLSRDIPKTLFNSILGYYPEGEFGAYVRTTADFVNESQFGQIILVDKYASNKRRDSLDCRNRIQNGLNGMGGVVGYTRVGWPPFDAGFTDRFAGVVNWHNNEESIGVDGEFIYVMPGRVAFFGAGAGYNRNGGKDDPYWKAEVDFKPAAIKGAPGWLPEIWCSVENHPLSAQTVVQCYGGVDITSE